MIDGGMEAVGEAVTGGLTARAVEPTASESLKDAQGACLNCDTPLVGPHCHRCGQAGHVHRSIAAWWHDLAHGVFHLDGKIWRTLPMLAWRPGELTRRYIAGERARFVSPLALFLFSVFLMFAVFSALGPDVGTVNFRTASARTAQEELQLIDARIARFEAKRAARIAQHKDTEGVDEQLGGARDEQKLLAATVARGGGAKRLVDTGLHTGWPALDHGLKKANENPALLVYKLQSNGYKFSWALIPISLPFLWLLFLHRRRYRQQYKAYDHLIFVTYSIAFMSLVIIAAVLLRSIGLTGAPIGMALLLIPPVHIYRQLRGAYALGRFSALWRTAAVLFFAVISLNLFLGLLLALGLMH